MVIPTVFIKEGVLNNVFYSSDEISKFINSWNGIPVPVNHPQDIKGNDITANQPSIQNSQNIGILYNTKFEKGCLNGEIWIDVDKAKRLGYECIINHFNDGKTMEVSTGLYCEIEKIKGTYNNNSYIEIAKNIRPDHLALLPSSVGACSIKDGCGASQSITVHSRKKVMIPNELSHNEIRNQLLDLLKIGDKFIFIIEIYNNRVIFELDNKLFMCSYTNNDDIISLVDDIKEVEIKYVSVKNKGEIDMEKDKTKDNNSKDNNSKDVKINGVMISNDDNKLLAKAKEGFIINGEDNDILKKAKEGTIISNEDNSLFEKLKANAEKIFAENRKKVAEHYNLDDKIVANMDNNTIESMLVNVNKDLQNKADQSGRVGNIETNADDDDYEIPNTSTMTREQKNNYLNQ